MNPQTWGEKTVGDGPLKKMGGDRYTKETGQIGDGPLLRGRSGPSEPRFHKKMCDYNPYLVGKKRETQKNTDKTSEVPPPRGKKTNKGASPYHG